MPTLDLGSVVGPQGKQGEIGPEGKQGIQGPPGPAGTNPYDYAVAGGYTGTEAEFQSMLGSGPWVKETGFVPASNPNLLDNWYFPDPINQRGIVSGTLFNAGYTLDRWMNFQANFAKWVSGEGLYFIGGNSGWQIVEQRMNADRFKVGTTLTASMLYHDGDSQMLKVISVTGKWGTTFQSIKDNGFYILLEYNVPVGIASFRMANYVGTDKVVVAAKLEYGSEQTLAHQDASGNWVLNDPPPNKVLELEKCQRYLRVLNSVGNANRQFGMGFAGGSDHVRIPYLIPVPMRANPTISYSGTFLAYKSSTISTSQALNVTNLNAVAIDRESMLLRAYVDGDLTPGDIYLLRSGTTEAGKITLDANL